MYSILRSTNIQTLKQISLHIKHVSLWQSPQTNTHIHTHKHTKFISLSVCVHVCNIMSKWQWPHIMDYSPFLHQLVVSVYHLLHISCYHETFHQQNKLFRSIKDCNNVYVTLHSICLMDDQLGNFLASGDFSYLASVVIRLAHISKNSKVWCCLGSSSSMSIFSSEIHQNIITVMTTCNSYKQCICKVMTALSRVTQSLHEAE